MKTCTEVSNRFVETRKLCANFLITYAKSDTPNCKLVCEELRMLTKQIDQRPILFSAAGFFDIKYSILLKLLGNISGYIVVLLQLSAET